MEVLLLSHCFQDFQMFKVQKLTVLCFGVNFLGLILAGFSVSSKHRFMSFATVKLLAIISHSLLLFSVSFWDSLGGVVDPQFYRCLRCCAVLFIPFLFCLDAIISIVQLSVSWILLFCPFCWWAHELSFKIFGCYGFYRYVLQEPRLLLGMDSGGCLG